MRWSRLALAGFFVSVTVAAQQPASNAPSTSALLQPALTRLDGAVKSIRPERWKLSRTSHEEMNDDVRSVGTDLSATLPALMSASDGAPGSLKALFAVSQNVDALYDVSLRVLATANVSAPDRESEQLREAVATLQDARRSLGARVSDSIGSHDAALHDAQTKLAAAKAAAAAQPAAVVCPTPGVTKKKRAVTAKPAAVAPAKN